MNTLKIENIIGIDVGYHPKEKHTGVAHWSPHAQRFFRVESMHYEQLIKLVDRPTFNIFNTVFVIENPDLDKTTFMTEQKIIKLYSTRKQKISLAQAKNIRLNLAQKAGENQALAKVLIKMIRAENLAYIEIAPSARDRADQLIAGQPAVTRGTDLLLLKRPTKAKAGPFQELTGYKQRINEHARDAAMLVYGMSTRNALTLLKMQARNQSEVIKELLRRD